MSRYHKWISALFFFGLLIGAFGFGPGPLGPQTAGLQPALAGLAAESPDELVRVMVGARGDRMELAAQVEGLGGEVVRDLHIINALAAEMPAGQAVDLASYASVAWLSLDGPVVSTGKGGGGGGGGGGSGGGGGGGSVSDPCTTCPPNFYLDTLNVRPVWDMGYQGQGVAVAVIDSGVQNNGPDFVYDPSLRPNKQVSRIVERLAFNDDLSASDNNGHGTHVGGIIGGNGAYSQGLYAGIAPQADLISLAISDLSGMAYESDAVAALQWVLDNKDTYNIRVVNLSINTTTMGSYHLSPLNAAGEILWFNGIVVVASAGNKDSGTITVDASPANDPFFITVGASKEGGDSDRGNDMIANFSAYGVTMDGHIKPEIIAPGKDIISALAGSSTWDVAYPERTVLINGIPEYFRLSGTSMSAPMVSGAAALLLQAEPNLTPDQVKHRLMNTGGVLPGRNGDPYSYAYLDIYAALTSPTTESANTGLQASQLLWTGNDPITWNSVNWNSVNWNSVNWNSVNWNSVNWNSVNWNSVSFND